MCWTIFPVVSKLFTIFDGIKDEFYAEFGTKLRDFNKKKTHANQEEKDFKIHRAALRGEGFFFFL